MGPIWKILPLPTAVNPSSTIVCLQTRLPAKPGLVTLECGWLAPAFGSGTCPASDKLACHPAPEARRKTAASCLRKSGGKPPALQSGCAVPISQIPAGRIVMDDYAQFHMLTDRGITDFLHQDFLHLENAGVIIHLDLNVHRALLAFGDHHFLDGVG